MDVRFMSRELIDKAIMKVNIETVFDTAVAEDIISKRLKNGFKLVGFSYCYSSGYKLCFIKEGE